MAAQSRDALGSRSFRRRSHTIAGTAAMMLFSALLHLVKRQGVRSHRLQVLSFCSCPQPLPVASGGTRCKAGCAGSSVAPDSHRVPQRLVALLAACGAADLSLQAAREGDVQVLQGDEDDSDYLSLPDTLPLAAKQVLRLLRSRYSQKYDEIPDHEFGPHLRKPLWTNLGQHLKACEEHTAQLTEDKWITLRLDGNSWGSLLGRLKNSGVLEHGFDDKIAEAMLTSCRSVMCEFDAVLGYTHSDEITLLVPPGTRALAGSSQAWVSIAASVASGTFNRCLSRIASDRGMVLEDVIVAHFDCRAGVFDTAEEALALVLWRASDCNTNSASDAIKFLQGLGVKKHKKMMRLNTIEKLSYLQAEGQLPLRRHQAYGSLFGRISEETGSRLVLLNSGIGGLPKHLLRLAKLGPLLPSGYLPDDCEQTSEDCLSIFERIKALPSDAEGIELTSWPCAPPQCLHQQAIS